MKYLIVGTGAVGMALLDELAKRGHQVTIINRSAAPKQIMPANSSYLTLDARDPVALGKLCDGVDCLIHAAGVGIAQAGSELPVLMDSIIKATSAAHTGVIYVDSMDAYGDNLGIPMSEVTPERPGNAYEALRAELGRTVMQAISNGTAKAQVARASTLYGPRVVHSPLGDALFGPIIAGKPGQLLGRMDIPHAFTFVKDLARSVAKLSEDDDSWGHLWHVPCPQPITQKQVLDILRDVCSRSVSAETITSGFFGMKTFFNPALKQYADILYRFERPYVVNHSRFSTTFGERTTSHEQALFETLEWFKQKAGISRRYGF